METAVKKVLFFCFLVGLQNNSPKACICSQNRRVEKGNARSLHLGQVNVGKRILLLYSDSRTYA